MRISIAASWKNDFLPSPRNIGRAAVRILIGRPRASVHRRSNSSPIHSGSSMTGIAPRAIVGATLHALAQPLPGTGRLALQALLEQARMPTWRLWARDAAIEKKMSSKPEVTPGALESSGDRNAGIGMGQTPIGRQHR